MNRRLLLKLVVAAFAAMPLALPAAAAEKVTVFAAASLRNALDAANAAWQKETGNETTVSYAASSALAKQIEAAAPADLFISADLAWMDYVAEKKLIKEDTRSNLLGNRIVLVAPKDKASTVEIKEGFDLAGLVGEGKLAMGAVDSVPAGKYGKAALEKRCRKRARGARPRLARRGALRHRLPDRRRRRSRRRHRRNLPGRQPSADHLPGRDPFGIAEHGCGRLSRLPEVRQGRALLHRAGFHPSQVRRAWR
jgi:Ni/Co efflux regulator RcnB